MKKTGSKGNNFFPPDGARNLRLAGNRNREHLDGCAQFRVQFLFDT